MSRSGAWVWAILLCALAFVARPAEALPPNACVPLFDPDYDRASLAYANVEVSDDRSACFLLPRNVIHKELREFNNQSSVFLEPIDLLRHLKGKAAVSVGDEERKIDGTLNDCLSAPVPEAIIISDGPPFPSPTPATLKSELLDIDLPLELAVSDLPGYSRYISVGPRYREDYYFPDAGPDTHLAFWCGNHTNPEMCSINGEYDGMKAAIRFLKDDMQEVRVKEALECVGRIGDLFRIDNDKS